MKRPWMQLFTRDWLDNKELRRCSPESRSVLIDLMCLASEGNPFGFLADDIGPLKDEFMASRCSMTTSKFRRAFLELVKYERVSTVNGVFSIPRMVRDEEIRRNRIEAGKTGGNPNLVVNQNDNLEVNHHANQSPDTRAHTRSDSDFEVLKALKPEQQTETSNFPSTNGHSGNGSGKVLPMQPPNRWQYQSDQSFNQFAVAAREFWGEILVDEDLQETWMFSWRPLDFEQKLAVVQSLQRRIETGEDANYVSRPPNYIKNGAWKRVARKSQPAKETREEKIRRELMEN